MGSKVFPAPTGVLEVANNALEFMRYSQDHLKWLAALMKAIQLDVEHNHSRTLLELASLAHYLSGDCADFLKEQCTQLLRQLDLSGMTGDRCQLVQSVAGIERFPLAIRSRCHAIKRSGRSTRR